jgi:hypothetical protein
MLQPYCERAPHLIAFALWTGLKRPVLHWHLEPPPLTSGLKFSWPLAFVGQRRAMPVASAERLGIGGKREAPPQKAKQTRAICYHWLRLEDMRAGRPVSIQNN